MRLRYIPLSLVFVAFSGIAKAQEQFGYTILDMTIVQNNDSLTLNEVPSDWPLTFSITAQPGPLSISLPMEDCDPDAEATYVRAYDVSVAKDLDLKLSMALWTARIDAPIDIIFPPGGGFAADFGPQRVLFVEDPKSSSVDQGFNAFSADRYAQADAEFVTLTIDRIEGAGWDPMTANKPFVLMIGRAGCGGYAGLPVALVAVNY